MMRRVFSVLAVLVWGASGAGAEVAVPSGQDIKLHEVFLETDPMGAKILRMRFLTPGIERKGGGLTYGDVEEDFQHLCEAEALPLLKEANAEADSIVISMMDRVVEFGASDSSATQFFEQFRHNSASCIWDEF